MISKLLTSMNFRISFNNLNVTLVTGQGVHNIQNRDRILDVFANAPPIALRTPAANDPAQMWSFFDALPVTHALRLEDGNAYKIVNSQTGTVLGVADTTGKPGTYALNVFSIHLQPLTSFRLSLVLGLISMGGDHHKVGHDSWSAGTLHSLHSQWIITEVTLDCFTFKSTTLADHFLAPDVAENDRPESGTALIGRAGQAAQFTVRKVPGTRLYKCGVS